MKARCPCRSAGNRRHSPPGSQSNRALFIASDMFFWSSGSISCTSSIACGMILRTGGSSAVEATSLSSEVGGLRRPLFGISYGKYAHSLEGQRTIRVHMIQNPCANQPPCKSLFFPEISTPSNFMVSCLSAKVHNSKWLPTLHGCQRLTFVDSVCLCITFSNHNVPWRSANINVLAHMAGGG